ncbi:MAG TPA: TonB-dependent receptor, partial [Acidovorax sp.]|nr:TonB-dependent receptor [Acidovorax sp.]
MNTHHFLHPLVHTRSHAHRGRAFPAALRPLCALLAALPFATLAQQEATLQTITTKATVEPVGANHLDAHTLQSGRSSSSDTAGLLRNLPGVSLFG